VSAEPSVAAVSGESFALTEGLRETRGAIERWRADPGAVLRPWFAGALAVACGLLMAILAVALAAPPDISYVVLIGVWEPASVVDAIPILGRNLLVLALHATACVAGFIAGSSMRRVAETKTGLSRVVHERAGPIAIAWVVAVTAFSLITQAIALGFDAAWIAQSLQIDPGILLLTVLPHALIELTPSSCRSPPG